MAFKVEKKDFDWDIELPLISGAIEIVKCVKQMNSDNYSKFIKHVQNLSGSTKEEILEKKKEVREDASTGIDIVIKQIDWLYEKGQKWWQENVVPDVIVQIQDHVFDYTAEMNKKKESSST